jgi:hypothetical protein
MYLEDLSKSGEIYLNTRYNMAMQNKLGIVQLLKFMVLKQKK